MPAKHHKDREKDEYRDRERSRTEKKDKSSRGEKDRNRERDRPGSYTSVSTKKTRSGSRTTNSAGGKDSEVSSKRPSLSSILSPSKSRTSSMPTPEMDRPSSTTSPHSSRVSLPYPSFSKAHSKEAVGSRENVASSRNLFTPEATDLGGSKSKDTSPKKTGESVKAGAAPPSPPLTAVEPDITKGKKEALKVDTEARRSLDTLLRPAVSKGSLRKHSKSGSASPARSKSMDKERPKSKNATVEDVHSATGSSRPLSEISAGVSESRTESDATAMGPKAIPRPLSTVLSMDDSSPTTNGDSEPKTPQAEYIPLDVKGGETPMVEVQSMSQTPSSFISPQPPPPPPPPTVPSDIPRVDYLLQYGGLSQTVPKTLLSALRTPAARQYEANEPPRTPSMASHIESIFAPYHKLLEDYKSVLSMNGSIAVATGYRSVARKLLDRLEVVFARDISSESCHCVICQSHIQRTSEDERGLGWGEVLELVSGRRELPPRPSFDFKVPSVGLGIHGNCRQTPMQHLDIDVPEEYRDHYIRQSRKTKQAVDSWLANQSTAPLPQDIDDDTMTFAILTYLDPTQRQTFSTLLGIKNGPAAPEPRAPTPAAPQAPPTPQLGQPKPRSELLIRTGIALQRLYRLGVPPRDPESAIFLLNNPSLHRALATIAAITADEWDILTSGRFDGFLWSGAEGGPTPTRQTPSNGFSGTASPLNRSTSRGQSTTPFHSLAAAAAMAADSAKGTPVASSIPPSPSPGANPVPVAIDEETEIATLAEIEREIYLGMEVLEDAFEALHAQAESVRNALRERGAGLSMAATQRRMGMNPGIAGGDGGVEVRMNTPWEPPTPGNGNRYAPSRGPSRTDASSRATNNNSGWGFMNLRSPPVGGQQLPYAGAPHGYWNDVDAGWDGAASEVSLAPDDSASNISSARKRRPRRREERRTPAPVNEEYGGPDGLRKVGGEG